MRQYPLAIGVLAGLLSLLSWDGRVSRAEDPSELTQQITVSGENTQLARRLQAADQLVRPDLTRQEITAAVAAISQRPLAGAVGMSLQLIKRQKWPDAFDEYLQLLAEEGDPLVLLPEDATASTTRTLSLRRLVHRRLAWAPASMRAIYRQRVDEAAKKLFDEGKARRDTRTLRRLIDEYFCSRWTEPALDLLGDIAFERGNLDEALTWWRLLVPPATESTSLRGRLVYADVTGDPARVRAKQILAYHFAGAKERADKELTAFRGLHPQARGTLAGQDDTYLSILEKALRTPAPLDDEPWATFAASAARQPRIGLPLPRRMLEQAPTWRVAFKLDVPAKKGPVAQSAWRLAFHPIILPDQVVVADARTVACYARTTGKVLFRHEFRNDPVGSTDPQDRFSVTVAGNRIYARTSSSRIGPGIKSESRLVCLDMPALGAKDAAVREAWSVSAAKLAGADAFLEGVPLVQDRRAYLAVSRLSGKNTLTFLACLDAVTGRTHWLRELGETPEFHERSGVRHDPHLVTLTATSVVYCSHSGLIAAVDRATGKVEWVVRYPARNKDVANIWPRETNPCVYHDQRLYVAPHDTNRVYCLAAASGQVLWEREGIDVVHVVGVARDNLIVTTPRGVRACAAATGLDRWQQPSDGDIASFGRGLIAGDKLYWPTRDKHFPMRVLDVTDGAPESSDPSRLHRLRAGNLAYAYGCLAVATLNELLVFVNPE
jgi:outer membrane protein assembly factor BamB